MDLRGRIEAILYASEHPVSVSDMAQILNEDQNLVNRELRKLSRSLDERNSALCVKRSGIRYKIQLRKEYLETVIPVAEPEFRSDELLLITYIAAHPDCKRGDLRNNFGEDYAETVEKFLKLGLINSAKYRNTELYRITKKFYSYFNISENDIRQTIKDGGDGK
jgi:segregation and condensation protein B